MRRKGGRRGEGLGMEGVNKWYEKVGGSNESMREGIGNICEKMEREKEVRWSAGGGK